MVLYLATTAVFGLLVSLEYLNLLGTAVFLVLSKAPESISLVRWRPCVHRAKPTTDSDACRPLVPRDVDHFSGVLRNGWSAWRNEWSTCSGIRLTG